MGQMALPGHPLVKCRLHDDFDVPVKPMPGFRPVFFRVTELVTGRAGERAAAQPVDVGPANAQETGSHLGVLPRQWVKTERAQHTGDLGLTFGNRGESEHVEGSCQHASDIERLVLDANEVDCLGSDFVACGQRSGNARNIGIAQ